MLHCCKLTNVLYVSALLAHSICTGLLSTSCSLSVKQGSARQMRKAARQHCSSSGTVRWGTTACRAWLSCCATHLSNSRPAQMVVCGMQLSSLLCHCPWHLYNPRSRSACTGHMLPIYIVTLIFRCLTASNVASYLAVKQAMQDLSQQQMTMLCTSTGQCDACCFCKCDCHLSSTVLIVTTRRIAACLTQPLGKHLVIPEHLPNVETHFYCLQAFLTLPFQL